MLPAPRVARFLLATLVLLASGCRPLQPQASSSQNQAAAGGGAVAAAPPAGIDRIYTDPQGIYSVPVPTGWTLQETSAYTLLADPEGSINVYLLAVQAGDLAGAIAAAWLQVDGAFALETDDSLAGPSAPGIEETLEITYKTLDENRIVQANG